MQVRGKTYETIVVIGYTKSMNTKLTTIGVGKAKRTPSLRYQGKRKLLDSASIRFSGLWGGVVVDK